MSSDPQEPIDDLLDAAETSRRREEAGPTDRQFRIIRFRTGNREFAIPIESVERTERVPMITPIPRCPGFVRGLSNLRGGVVCVVDLSRFLSGKERDGGVEHRSLLVIADHLPERPRRVAILSETLPDFETVVESETMSVPGTEVEIYSCAVERSDGMVGVIDPGRLFDQIERRLTSEGS